MTANQVDYLNIGLMLVALVAAALLPFEVFLFSYAILGPLHYLTEISWLHDRNYFSPKKVDWVPLAALGIVILLGAKSVMGPGIVGALSSIGLGPAMDWIDKYVYDITFLAFGLAFVFVVFKDWAYRIGAIMVLLLAAWIFALPEPIQPITTQQQQDLLINKYSSPFFKAFAVYIPTLLHVYVFTGAFILYGALKRRSNAGYLSFAAFVAIAILCLVLPNFQIGAVSDWAYNSYKDTFLGLNKYLVTDFGGKSFLDGPEPGYYFTDPLSLKLTRFIAFAYTYHYLNWFSKTSVIQWHKVPKVRFAIVIAAWVASVVLYIMDYMIGFRWLFLLSFLHVLLEFPLNHVSFIGIGKELGAILGGKKVVAKG